MAEFKLPDVGEGLTEAEIVSWKVKEGDTVEINEVLVEIETAKSLVELPSPFAGPVLQLLVPEGEMVPVGTPIISIGDASQAGGEAGAGAGDAGDKTPGEEAAELEIDLSNPAASGGGEGESLVGRNKADRGPQRRQGGHPAVRGGGQHAAAAAGRLRAGRRPVPGRRRLRRARGPGHLCRTRRAGRRTSAREASGPQARQGPRDRPLHPHRVR